MTPAEINEHLRAIRARVGGKSDVILSFMSEMGVGDGVRASIYIGGIAQSGGAKLNVGPFDTFEALFAALTAEWDRYEAHHHAETIKAMALEIIRLTSENGSCTEFALRTGRFSAAEVKRFGDLAIAEANRMADLGPFSIIAATVSNHEAA